jgi:hypothetical protein
MGISRSSQIEAVRAQVQRNCDLSDAQNCGAFSLCSFILLIRNFYKWFHHIEPWNEGEPAHTLEWIAQREALWEEIQDRPFSPIVWQDKSYDPYDLEGINLHLDHASLVYGAGYAYGMKPTFFLAEVERIERLEGMEVIFLGREYARDMPGFPALRQGDRIYLRKESARYYLYDKISEHLMAGKKPMVWAMRWFDVHEIADLRFRLDSIVGQEIMAMAYHELGEAAEDVFGERWGELLSLFPMTSVERFARALKDVLADTHPRGLLNLAIKGKLSGVLGMYVSMLDGFSALLFPEIRRALDRFMEHEDWGLIEAARKTGYDRLRSKAEQLVGMLEEAPSKGKAAVREEVEYFLIKPLYCDK